jgi:hypothetical protein
LSGEAEKAFMQKHVESGNSGRSAMMFVILMGVV